MNELKLVEYVVMLYPIERNPGQWVAKGFRMKLNNPYELPITGAMAVLPQNRYLFNL